MCLREIVVDGGVIRLETACPSFFDVENAFSLLVV
jgi:hypothetical protein